ncbi:MAG: anti-sigma factor [Jatrophihabitans sp.]
MTNNHLSDDLPLLLTGDATRAVVLEAATHLRSCVDCQQELVSAVVAHASLMSAHRFAPEIVAPKDSSDDNVVELPPISALPDLSKVFAEARAEDVTPTRVHHLRSRRALVAVAASAAVIVGGGATYLATQSDTAGPNTRTVALAGQSAALNGSAVLVGNNRMRIDASKLPPLSAGKQYEVWLTDGTQKQPVGYIDSPDRKKELTVPSKVMSQYNQIAVSVQQPHQTEYSGITVLRGTYG